MTPADHVASLREVGYTVIPNVLDDAELETARTLLNDIFADERDIAEQRHWATAVYLVSYMLPQKRAFFRQLPLNPRLLPIMEAAIAPDCLMSSLNGLSMTPGGNTQGLHKDGPSIPGCIMSINALHALDDFRIDNGCTRLVPRSQHRRTLHELTGVDDHRAARECAETMSIPVTAPAGSVIAYDGGLWHAGSKNTSQGPRRALHLFYTQSWVRPQWDYERSLSPEVQASMTPEQRRIFGLDRPQNWYDWRTHTASKV